MADLLELSSRSARYGQTRVVVDPHQGAAILSYASCVDGQTWHWLASSAESDSQQGHVAGFVMVPFCSRIREGRFSYGGLSVELPANNPPERHPIHGHGFMRTWQVLEQCAAAVTLGYSHAADVWPWSYNVTLNLRLEDVSLVITATLHNRSTLSMPAGLGFHPYFPRREKTRILASVVQWLPLDAQLMPLLPQAVPGDINLATGYLLDKKSLDHVFMGWDGYACIQWPAQGAELTLTSTPAPGHLVIWAPQGEAYVCVEPVSNLPDGFNHPELPDSFVDLAPDGTHTVQWRLTPRLGVHTDN